MPKNYAGQFESLVQKCRLQGSRRQNLFSCFVKICRRRGIRPNHITIANSLIRGLEIWRPHPVGSWDDIDAVKEQVRCQLTSRIKDESFFINGVYLAAKQMVHEGVLAPRHRHRTSGICSRCGRTKVIENVKHMLCPHCVGEATLPQRFNALCERFSFADKKKTELFEALLIYERRHPVTINSWSRVYGLGTLLSEWTEVPQLRSWPDVRVWKERLRDDTKPGRAHKAQWALYKVCQIFIERGLLDVRPPKTTGTLPEQLEAIASYFYVEDPYRRKLLRILIDYFSNTRVTITAVQTVQGFAYYLAKQAVPPIRSWDDIHALIRDSPGEDEPWHRRIKTALRRLGDALQQSGQIKPCPHRQAVAQLTKRFTAPTTNVLAINEKFLISLHEHGRRPITLEAYLSTLNCFWTWLGERNVSHPSHVSGELLRGFLKNLRTLHWNVDRISRVATVLRQYFEWLRRNRMVLKNPVPAPEGTKLPIVRVLDPTLFESLLSAMMRGELPDRQALVLYLLAFYGFRNYEVIGAKAIGFRHRKGLETFDIELPLWTPSAGHIIPSRRQSVIHLPTGRYRWLHDILTAVTDERARLIKQPENPHLFVRESWRRGALPMNEHTVTYLVRRATERVCGFPVTPTLFRQTAGSYFADISDHSICRIMGWSPYRAVELAYAPREIVSFSSPNEMDPTVKTENGVS